MKEIKSIQDINMEIIECDLLVNAIILISTTTHTGKTFEEIIEKLNSM